MKTQSNTLEQTVGHTLAHVGKVYRAKSDALLRTHGLHAGQDTLLMSLWAEEGVTQSQLAAQLSVQPATLTNMLHRMVAADLAVRKPDPYDQRVWRVHLTPHGRALQNKLHEVWDELERRITLGMSAEERTLLRRLLLQVSQNLVSES